MRMHDIDRIFSQKVKGDRVMFRILTVRDITNKDPTKRNNITGFIVEIGYSCQESHWCPHGFKCKYRDKYRWNNFMMKTSEFFEQHFNVRFNLPIYFQKHSADLSGSSKCPYQVPKIYTCLDCEYACGFNCCGNELRNKLLEEGRFSEINYPIEDYIHSKRCKLFYPNNLCEDYAILIHEHTMNLMYITTRRDDNADS